MKHTYISLALAAMALTTGCSQNELVEDSSTRSDRSIAFSNYLVRPNSRATEVKIEELKTVGFKVWSYLSTKADGSDADIADAGNTIAAHALDGTDLFTWNSNAWTPAGGTSYYWPEDGKGKLSFYAISSSKPGMLQSVNIPTASTGASFVYGSSSSYGTEKMEDLVAAQLYNQTFGSNNGTVNLTFKHLLSQVRFTAKTATTDFKAKIQSIKVLRVARGGMFTFDITGATIGSWTVMGVMDYNDYVYFDAATADAATFPDGYPKDDADRDQPDGNKNSFITTTAKDIWMNGGTKAANGALMFIPHINGLEGKSLEITYQCYVLEDPVNKPGIYVKEGEVVKRTIPLTAQEHWPMNKIVRYNLTLTMPMEGYVSYDTAVEPWNDPNSDIEYHP